MSDLRKAIEEPPAGMQCKDIEDAPLLATIARKEAESGSWVTIWGFDGTPYGALPEKLLRAKMGKLIRRGLITGCICGCRGDFQMTDKGRDYIEWDTAITRLEEATVDSKNQRVEAAAEYMEGAIYYTEGAKDMREAMKEALAAADAVMFSEEAIERAAGRIASKFSVDQGVGEWSATAVWGTPEEITRAVVAALRGEA